MRKKLVYLSFFYLLFLSPLFALKAPDATEPGPHLVRQAEYHLPAQIYSDVLDDRETELWASMHYPDDRVHGANLIPLIVLLHGNHQTCGIGRNPHHDISCSYTETGSCPDGYQPVPNHKGYDYLAKHLASWGYMVLSINANRGITCGGGVYGDFGLNLARGRLVLKHLSQLYQWGRQQNTQPSEIGAPNLLSKIDFTQVGLFGHSRGGEGVRAAYNLYRDNNSSWQQKIPGLKIRAIFEIGAVDGQTNRILDAPDIAWNQLIPMCDGDVSDHQGRYPFDRMMLNPNEASNAQKSVYQVWGANHNFFNTEWQKSDARHCANDKPIFEFYGMASDAQQIIAKNSVLAFFKGQMGDEQTKTFNQNFNPLCELPDVIEKITQIDRDFTPTPSQAEYLSVEEFDHPTGVNSSGWDNESAYVKIEHQYADDDWPEPNLEKHPQRLAAIAWHPSTDTPYFKAVMTTPRQGIDISDYATLDMRITRKHHQLNITSETNFSIQLEDADGLLSNPVTIRRYAVVSDPAKDELILSTARVPLSAFYSVNTQNIHAVKFTFDQNPSGSIYLANIRFHKQFGAGVFDNSESAIIKNRPSQKADENPPLIPARMNHIYQIKRSFALVKNIKQPTIKITLQSEKAFDVLDSLPELHIGKQVIRWSQFPEPASLKKITFILTEKQYKQLDRSKKLFVKNGKIWQFPTLNHAAPKF